MAAPLLSKAIDDVWQVMALSPEREALGAGGGGAERGPRASAGTAANSRMNAAPRKSRDGRCDFMMWTSRLAEPQQRVGE